MRPSINHLCIDARLINCGAGIGTFLTNLIKNLEKRPRYKLTLLTSKQVKSPIYSFKEQWELPLKIPPCDLFISPHFNVPLFPIRAKKRVAVIHDAYHLDHYDTLSYPQKFYASCFYRAAAALSDGVITPSHFSKRQLDKHLAFKNIKVVYNLIEREKFEKTYLCTEKEKIRKKYSLPDQFILAFANKKPHKNLSNILLAYSQYASEQKGYLPLVLCGNREGIDFPREEKIFPVGFVEEKELSIFYQLATFFLFPSFYEGFGYPPVEAMSASCPVIAGRAGSLPEVCGEGVHYVDPRDSKNISAAMKLLHTNEGYRKELILKGQKQVESLCARHTFDAYLEFFEECLQ